MSYRANGTIHSIVRAITLLVIFALFCALIWDLAATTTKENAAAANFAEKFSSSSDERINSDCLGLDPSVMAKCISQIVQSTRENQRSEYELTAQQGTERWAFWMLWISCATTAITATGIFYVKLTLDETRAASNAAFQAADFARQTLHAERAWMTCDGISSTVVPDQGLNISLRWSNNGRSPAINATAVIIRDIAPPSKGVPVFEEDLNELASKSGLVNPPLGVGKQISTGEVFVPFSVLDKVASGEITFFIYSKCAYFHVFGIGKHHTEICGRVFYELNRATGDFRLYLVNMGPQNTGI